MDELIKRELAKTNYFGSIWDEATKNNKLKKLKITDTFSVKLELTEEWLKRYIQWVIESGEIIDIPDFKELNDKLIELRGV